MKKILVFLVSVLFTLNSFGQRFEVGMNYGADANVGEEIELKFEIFPEEGQEVKATFLQFDIQYNNKLIQYVSHTFDPFNKLTGASNAVNAWSGYQFNQDFDYSSSALYEQYLWWAGGAQSVGSVAYSSKADFSVNRYTIQSADDINLYDAVLTIKFKILDRQGTDYQNYTSAFQINWAQLKDNRDDTVYQLGSNNHQIGGLNPGGVGAGDVTITLDVPHANKQDYQYDIFAFSQLQGEDFDGDGEIDGYYPKQDETPYETGQFDSNGITSVSTLTLDEQAWINVYTVFDGQTHPEWLDDVVTVTDVYKAFQYSLDSDINGGGGSWEYEIQNILGEVTNDGVVNFDDSYELLAHVNGVVTSANVTSKDNGSFNLSALIDKYGTFGEYDDWHLFTPTEDNKSFTLGHGLRGDLDFSHSTVPVAQGDNATSSARQSSANQVISNRTVETQNLDISSRLEDGKVIVDVNLDTSGLVGSQFKIRYDESILTLDDIVYDTGNAMTNFGTVKGNVASFGSLDYEGNETVKTGRPYRLIFTPNENITNTVGLVSFKIVEGVKADGTKVKFQY